MKPTSLLLLLLPAAASGVLAQTGPQPSPDSGWRQTELRDAADTYTFKRFTLVGKFRSPPAGAAADRPAMRLDCIPPAESHRGKFLAADLLVGTPLKIVYVEPEEIRGTNYFPKVTVHYSTDGSGNKERNWEAGTDRIPTAKPSDKSSATIPADALKRMLRAHSVVITVDEEHGSPVEMQFDIPDPTSVEAACNMR
jgi:hypothetical protein